MIDENLNREEGSDVVLHPCWSCASRPLPQTGRTIGRAAVGERGIAPWSQGTDRR
jgi:hypothetical protein